jgi:hypothetical protein
LLSTVRNDTSIGFAVVEALVSSELAEARRVAVVALEDINLSQDRERFMALALRLVVDESPLVRGEFDHNFLASDAEWYTQRGIQMHDVAAWIRARRSMVIKE